MRRILASCVLSLALLPIAAHADTIDDFTLVGQGHTITYSLPNSAIVMNHPHAVWLNASAPATIDGVPGYNVSGEYYLPGFPSLPSVVLFDSSSIYSGDLTLYGPSVVQVSEIIPIDDPSIAHPNDLLVTFVPGTYVLHTLLGSAPFPTYTLTIAAESAPTPEPSTFALVGTGLLGAIAAVRLRSRIAVGFPKRRRASRSASSRLMPWAILSSMHMAMCSRSSASISRCKRPRLLKERILRNSAMVHLMQNAELRRPL